MTISHAPVSLYQENSFLKVAQRYPEVLSPALWIPYMSKGLWALSLCVLLSGALFINVICPDLSSLQSLTCVGLFATPWTAACQGSLSITNS